MNMTSHTYKRNQPPGEEVRNTCNLEADISGGEITDYGNQFFNYNTAKLVMSKYLEFFYFSMFIFTT